MAQEVVVEGDVSPEGATPPDWDVGGHLLVGQSGTGTLTVVAGGMVSNAFGIIGFGGDAEGTVTVTGDGSTWTNSSDLCVGEFGEVTTDFTFLDAMLHYDTEDSVHGVDLELLRNDIDFAEMAGTRNQQATAAAVDSLDTGNPVYDAVVTHTGSDAELRADYDRLSGELHASAHGALVEDSRLVREAANDRLRAAATAPMDVGDNPMASNPGSASGNTARPSTTWVRTIGNWGNNDGDGNAFTVAGTPIAENAAVVEAGVSLALNERASLDVAYGGQYGDGMEDHGARATFEWRF